MMKPKGIRKPGISSHRPSHGYSGVAVDILSGITITKTEISEKVEVNNPTGHGTESITEDVIVVVTP